MRAAYKRHHPPLPPHSTLPILPPSAPLPTRIPPPLVAMAKLPTTVVVALLLLAAPLALAGGSDECALEFSAPCEQVRRPAGPSRGTPCSWHPAGSWGLPGAEPRLPLLPPPPRRPGKLTTARSWAPMAWT